MNLAANLHLKENNWNYLDSAITMARPRATIFLDSIDNKRLIAESDKDENEYSRSCVIRAGQDSRIESLVLQTVGQKGWDNLMLCVVKDPEN